MRIKQLGLGLLLAYSCVSYGGQLLGYRDVNALGSVLSLGNGAGQTVTRSYHSDGSLSSSTNLINSSLVLVPNSLGQLSSTSVTSSKPSLYLHQLMTSGPMSPGVHYSYDPVTHRLLSEESVSGANSGLPGSKVAYSYNADGSVSTVTYSYLDTHSTSVMGSIKQYHVHYVYNSYGKVNIEHRWFGTSSTVPSSGVSTSYSFYNDLDRLIEIEHFGPNSSSVPLFSVSYTYDNRGQVEEIKRSPGYATYNIWGKGRDSGRLLGILIGSGSYADMSLSYAMVSAGISLGASYSNKGLSDLLFGEFYTYSYTGDVVKKSVFSNTDKLKGYVELGYDYDSRNRLTGFKVLQSSKAVVSFNSDVESSSHVPALALYPHDSFGTPLESGTYSYDWNDNLTSVTRTAYSHTEEEGETLTLDYSYYSAHPDRLKLITASGGGYPHEGLMAALNSTPYAYNIGGSVTASPDGETYTYNAQNEMLTVDLPNEVSIHYGYDGGGHLDYELSDLSSSASGINNNNEKVYFYGPGVSAQGDVTTTGMPGLATFTDTTTENKNKNKFTTAIAVRELYEVAQGNVALTGVGSTLHHEYVYSPYGVQSDVYHPLDIPSGITSYAGLEGSTFKPLDISKNRFGYTGQSLDPSSGMMMLGGIRNYAPGIGRFIQPDTYNSFSKHSISNPYAYVLGNPMYYTDPTGHFAWGGVWKGMVSDAAGFGAFLVTMNPIAAVAAQSAVSDALANKGKMSGKSFGMSVATNSASDAINTPLMVAAAAAAPESGGASAVAYAVVSGAVTGAVGGAASSMSSQAINNKGKIDYNSVSKSAVFGAAVGAVFGLADGAAGKVAETRALGQSAIKPFKDAGNEFLSGMRDDDYNAGLNSKISDINLSDSRTNCTAVTCEVVNRRMEPGYTPKEVKPKDAYLWSNAHKTLKDSHYMGIEELQKFMMGEDIPDGTYGAVSRAEPGSDGHAFAITKKGKSIIVVDAQINRQFRLTSIESRVRNLFRRKFQVYSSDKVKIDSDADISFPESGASPAE